VIGAVDNPYALLLGRLDARQRLKYVARTAPLALSQRQEIVRQSFAESLSIRQAADSGGEDMMVEWSATSPHTGLYSSAVRRSDLNELEGHFIALRSFGEGFLEVSLPTADSPEIALGFRGVHAVVEQLRALDEDPKCFLLVGDGSVLWDGTVKVPHLEGDAVFTGHFVMRVDRAWDAVREFVRTGSTAGLGEWYEL
jgi:hypothetical protein